MRIHLHVHDSTGATLSAELFKPAQYADLTDRLMRALDEWKESEHTRASNGQFGAGESALAKVRLAKKPRLFNTGFVHPFGTYIQSELKQLPRADFKKINERYHDLDSSSEGGTERVVEIAALKTVQQLVEPEKLSGMLKAGGVQSLPVVVDYHGQLVLWDGNHRVSLALLAGRKLAKVRVFPFAPTKDDVVGHKFHAEAPSPQKGGVVE